MSAIALELTFSKAHHCVDGNEWRRGRSMQLPNVRSRRWYIYTTAAPAFAQWH
jgi:hypothetical protein